MLEVVRRRITMHGTDTELVDGPNLVVPDAFQSSGLAVHAATQWLTSARSLLLHPVAHGDSTPNVKW
jgi:hypothetical protein